MSGGFIICRAPMTPKNPDGPFARRFRADRVRYAQRYGRLPDDRPLDPDYVYAFWWVPGTVGNFSCSGFLDPRRFVQWLKQEAEAGRIPDQWWLL
jgi:hypothetical protein